MSSKERLKKQNKILKDCLRAIRDYRRDEICYDEFAYERMAKAYRKAAKDGLRAAREVEE